MTLSMLVLFGGRERSSAELAALAASAGWRLSDHAPAGHGLHLITLEPAWD